MNLEFEKTMHSLDLFQSITLEKESKSKPAKKYRNRWIFNAGISVWGLDFCPLSVACESQYLAVGGYKSTTENRVLGLEQQAEFFEDPRMAQMIQIWEIKKVGPPKMVLGILHKYGCLYDLKWCPSLSATLNKNSKNVNLQIE